MLTFQDFFTACSGFWTTQRTYHSLSQSEVERSYTEFRVDPLTPDQKQQMLPPSEKQGSLFNQICLIPKYLEAPEQLPGFAIAFDTRSEKGEQVSMSLRALFIPDFCLSSETTLELPPLPPVAQISGGEGEGVQGFYLRDEGYSEAGEIVGRFTYQLTRQTLEMTTFYRRSVAVDQMRLIAPNLRLRTIVTYRRPQTATGEATMEPLQTIDLIGFGVEHRQ